MIFFFNPWLLALLLKAGRQWQNGHNKFQQVIQVLSHRGAVWLSSRYHCQYLVSGSVPRTNTGSTFHPSPDFLAAPSISLQKPLSQSQKLNCKIKWKRWLVRNYFTYSSLACLLHRKYFPILGVKNLAKDEVGKNLNKGQRNIRKKYRWGLARTGTLKICNAVLGKSPQAISFFHHPACSLTMWVSAYSCR